MMTSVLQPFHAVRGPAAEDPAGLRSWIFEMHDSVPSYRTEPEHLCFWMPMSGAMQVNPGSARNGYTFAEGRIAMLPPGSVWKGAWRGRITCVMLEVAAPVLREFTRASIRFPEQGRLLITEDEQLRYSLLALHQNLLAHDSPDDLFVKHLGRGIAAHYLQRYCRMETGGRDRTRLSERDLNRALEVIESRLGGKVSLDALAAELQMTVTTFCRRFRNCTGMAPYQYVLHRRIELAKAALEHPDSSMSEIALSLGFYDQSQFTNTFRRRVGLSPRAYRRQLRR